MDRRAVLDCIGDCLLFDRVAVVTSITPAGKTVKRNLTTIGSMVPGANGIGVKSIGRRQVLFYVPDKTEALHLRSDLPETRRQVPTESLWPTEVKTG